MRNVTVSDVVFDALLQGHVLAEVISYGSKTPATVLVASLALSAWSGGLSARRVQWHVNRHASIVARTSVGASFDVTNESLPVLSLPPG
mgnify:FL=1